MTIATVSTLRPAAIQRPPSASVKLLCVVEGANDIEFLVRISRIIATARPGIPDLASLQKTGELAILPRGGGDLLFWADRLAPLGAKQFHLSDREIEPECHSRQQAVRMLNRRAGCRAAVTRKRTLENYLHPAAIFEARGVDVEFHDQDDVAEVVARRLFAARIGTPQWANLPSRARKRLCYRVKKWLNTKAVDRMTYERLADRGGAEEITGWLSTIRELLAAA